MTSPDPTQETKTSDEFPSDEFRNAGVGAASALEQMKSERATRHRRQHGTRPATPIQGHGGPRGHHDDHIAER